MTVGELKKLLNNYDEDMEVKTYDEDGHYVSIDLDPHTIVERGRSVDVLLIW